MKCYEMLQRLTVDFRKHASAAACRVDEAPPVMVLEADVAPASEASAIAARTQGHGAGAGSALCNRRRQRLCSGHPWRG